MEAAAVELTMWSLNKFVLVVGLLFLPKMALADLQNGYDWQWGGFVTQGWSISDRNNFFGRSSGSHGAFSFRELGLNATVQLTSEVSVNGQLLSRWAGEVDKGGADVDYLFADWSWLQQESVQAGFRIGRIKNPIGFYNDTRDVAFTRPSALLPQSIYQDRVRELLLSSDGVAAYFNSGYENGNLLLDLQLGKPQVGKNSELSLLGRDWDGKYQDAELKLARVLYEHDGGKYRLGLTLVDAESDFDGKGSDPFQSGAVEIFFIGYSAQYNQEYFSLTAEYVEETVKRKDFNGVYSNPENTVEAFYLQADFRLKHRWTLFARYDEVIADRDDKDGGRYRLSTGLPAHQRFAKDWAIGVGHQYSPSLLLRGEFHHVDGTAWLPSLDNPNPSVLKRDWNLFLFQASYRF
ncbi:MAG: hypothetical protein V7739_20975 [Motiliproteus sp.]